MTDRAMREAFEKIYGPFYSWENPPTNQDCRESFELGWNAACAHTRKEVIEECSAYLKNQMGCEYDCNLDHAAELLALISQPNKG